MNIRVPQLAILAALASCASPSARLDSLATELHQRRSMQAGTPTYCPENTKQLIGTTLGQVKARLGPPDSIRGNETTYFFGSPWVIGRAGGGSPELTFISESGVVTDVLCLYSQ